MTPAEDFSVLPPFEIIFTLAAANDQGYLAGRPLGDDFLQRLVIALLR